MSSETIADRQIETESHQHTMPSPEELEAQAKLLGLPCIGAHKNGKCAVEARLITDGYAYKTMGADPSAPWEWMRRGDFESQFRVYRDATEELSDLRSMNMIMARMIKTAMQSMSTKSVKKLTRKLGERGIAAMKQFTQR